MKNEMQTQIASTVTHRSRKPLAVLGVVILCLLLLVLVTAAKSDSDSDYIRKADYHLLSEQLPGQIGNQVIETTPTNCDQRFDKYNCAPRAVRTATVDRSLSDSKLDKHILGLIEDDGFEIVGLYYGTPAGQEPFRVVEFYKLPSTDDSGVNGTNVTITVSQPCSEGTVSVPQLDVEEPSVEECLQYFAEYRQETVEWCKQNYDGDEDRDRYCNY